MSLSEKTFRGQEKRKKKGYYAIAFATRFSSIFHVDVHPMTGLQSAPPRIALRSRQVNAWRLWVLSVRCLCLGTTVGEAYLAMKLERPRPIPDDKRNAFVKRSEKCRSASAPSYLGCLFFFFFSPFPFPSSGGQKSAVSSNHAVKYRIGKRFCSSSSSCRLFSFSLQRIASLQMREALNLPPAVLQFAVR